MKNNTIDSKLLNAQVAIDNALSNTTIKDAMALFGYDEAKLQAGAALYEAAQAAQNKQKQEYGEQFSATDALDTAMSAANQVYMRHVKVARIALRGQRGAAEALQLMGRRQQSYSGWIKQASIFYTNALIDEGVKTALSSFGITEQALQEGQDNVNDVQAKLAAQLKEKGEAQASTQARDESLEDLLDWMSDFVAIARIALENDAQLLEVLGIVEPS
jgi:vacuolar-type H+-ATPase subunit I/STV1